MCDLETKFLQGLRQELQFGKWFDYLAKRIEISKGFFIAVISMNIFEIVTHNDRHILSPLTMVTLKIVAIS